MEMRAVIALLAAGCWYHPGSFEHATTPFAGARVQLVCLDVAVTVAQDERAAGHVLGYAFGNRCSHSTIVDLTAVHVIGRDTDGTKFAMQPYDPKHELRPLPIDGLWHGYEEIEYASQDPHAPRDVCADVGRMEPGPDAEDHWLCLGMVDEGATP
jgi:hypothetical protein